MSRLAEASPEMSEGPLAPPCERAAKVVRSRPLIFEEGWWQPWQLRWKMGRTSREKLTGVWAAARTARAIPPARMRGIIWGDCNLAPRLAGATMERP